MTVGAVTACGINRRNGTVLLYIRGIPEVRASSAYSTVSVGRDNLANTRYMTRCTTPESSTPSR